MRSCCPLQHELSLASAWECRPESTRATSSGDRAGCSEKDVLSPIDALASCGIRSQEPFRSTLLGSLSPISTFRTVRPRRIVGSLYESPGRASLAFMLQSSSHGLHGSSSWNKFSAKSGCAIIRPLLVTREYTPRFLEAPMN